MTTPSGPGTGSQLFAYTSAPVVSSIAPASGPVTGGQPVTITGQNFTNAQSVTIGGISVATFTVVNSNTITTTTPSVGSAGQADVVVATPVGTGTGAKLYTYVNLLTLASLPPATQQVGKTYSQQNTASNGTPQYTYSFTGTLPPGTSLSSSTGLVFGTPTAFGKYTYTITATDSTVPPLTASNQITANIAAVTSNVSLTSSVNPSLLGQATTLTASVTPNTCSGTITFTDGAATLCSAAAVVNGVLSCTIKFTAPGSHFLKASYSGSAACTPSSAVLTQTVNDQRPQTVSAIGNFLSQRNNLLLSEQPDMNRQVDRLKEAGDIMDGKPVSRAPITASGTGFGTPGRLGSNDDSTAFPDASSGGLTQVSRINTSSNPFGLNGVPAGTRAPLAFGTSVASLNGQDADPVTGGGSLTAGPLRVVGNTTGVSTFGFSTSLRDVLNYSGSMEQAKIANAGQGFSPGSKYNPGVYYSPFDIWVEGKYTSFKDNSIVSAAGNSLSGEFGLFSVGADYVFNRWLLAGVMAQYDLMYQRAPVSGSMARVSGEGWTAGPYATIRLSENIFWQARGAWGQSANEVSPYGTYSNNFGSQRWLATSALQGRWGIGNWMFRPTASVSYIEDDSKSYVDSFGVVIPEVKSQLGQAKAGPEIGYRYQYSPDLLIEPHLGVQAIYNFAGSVTSSVGLVPGESAGPAGARGRLEIGQRAVTSGGVSLDLGASYDGIGSKGYDAYSAHAQVHVPLD